MMEYASLEAQIAFKGYQLPAAKAIRRFRSAVCGPVRQMADSWLPLVN